MTDARKIPDFRLPPDLLGVQLLGIGAWAWLLVAIPFFADTATPFPLLDLCFAAAWIALACAWFVSPIVSAAGLRWAPWRRWWIAAGVAGVIGLIVAATDLGLVVRLFLCERQLTAYAAAVAPGTSDVLQEPTSVGLFRVDKAEEDRGAVYLYTNSHQVGLVYFPGGTSPPYRGGMKTHHLYGPWHLFRWKF
jgi:hypothetical protein